MFGQIIIYLFAVLMLTSIVSYQILKKKDTFENNVNSKGYGSLSILVTMLAYLALAFLGQSQYILFTLTCLIVALLLSFANTIMTFRVKDAMRRATYSYRLQIISFVVFIALDIADYLI